MKPMKLKILIVDDFQETVINIKEKLKKHYSNKALIEGTSDPYIALDMIANRKPEIVILDHQMPNLDGSMLIERVKRAHDPEKYTPNTILISRLYQHSNNFDYFLPKPINFEKLNLLVDRIIKDIYLNKFKKIEPILKAKKLTFSDIFLLRRASVDLNDFIYDEKASNKSLHEAIASITARQPDTVRNHLRKIRQLLGFLGQDIQLARYIMRFEDKIGEIEE